MADCKSKDTPMEVNPNLWGQGEQMKDIQMYRKWLGKLLCTLVTETDFAHLWAS